MTPHEMRREIREGWRPGTTGKGLIDVTRGRVWTWPTAEDDDFDRAHSAGLSALGLAYRDVAGIVLAADGGFGVHYPSKHDIPTLVELVERSLPGAFYRQRGEAGYQED